MNNQLQVINVEPTVLTLERSQNMKNITVVSAASGQHNDLTIPPGTTVRDIRQQLGLDNGFILTTGRGSEPFADDENIYPAVPDGAKLYASTPVEVGTPWTSANS
jgi:hypothetical protein